VSWLDKVSYDIFHQILRWQDRALAILFSTPFDLRCKQLKNLLILRSQKLALSESEDARFWEAELQKTQPCRMAALGRSRR
jgi:hypothetical protein